MTGQQPKKAEAPERVPRKGDNTDHAAAYELMKRMGSKSGYTPLPPDQHRWQGRKGEAPLNRIWSWMVQHTCAWGHRSEFAVGKDNRELHIEHVAADLSLDIANAYRYWKEGCAKGLWRCGTAEEGERRLYLCGSVPIPKGEDEAKEIVCTDNFPAYISCQINNWSRDKLEKFTNDWHVRQEVRKQLGAAAMAAVRSICDRDDDTMLAQYEVKPRRQEHQKNGETEEQAAARRARYAPLVAPLELFVQTIPHPVQSENGTSYDGRNGSVQTTASLLPSEVQKEPEKPSAGGSSATAVTAGPAKGNSNEELDAARSNSASRRKAAGEAQKILGARELPPLQGELLETETLLFNQIAQMQEAFKHADFARERIDPDNASDRLFVRRVLNTVRPENAMLFLVYVAGQFKGLDRDGMAKAPPRAPGSPHGPRSLGLILLWAKDWARKQMITPVGLEGV